LEVPLEDGSIVTFSGTFSKEEVETLVQSALVYFIRAGLLPMNFSPEQVIPTPIDAKGTVITQ